jgi:urea carboxylase-associated protein 2
VLQPGASWSHVLKRGTSLQLTDLQGGANVSALFFNFEIPVERYNMPDTLKGQHTFFLTRGHALYSDMGRVLVSIPDDDCGWHDTVCGHSTAQSVLTRFGEARYQQHRNEFHRNARDGFLTELAKYGLGPRDLMANVNFFSKASVEADGALRWWPEHSRAGMRVQLRAELNTLVVLNASPHPLHPAGPYPRKPVELTVWSSGPAGEHDVCRTSCEQNRRAFANTERYFQ